MVILWYTVNIIHFYLDSHEPVSCKLGMMIDQQALQSGTSLDDFDIHWRSQSDKEATTFRFLLL